MKGGGGLVEGIYAEKPIKTSTGINTDSLYIHIPLCILILSIHIYIYVDISIHVHIYPCRCGCANSFAVRARVFLDGFC